MEVRQLAADTRRGLRECRRITGRQGSALLLDRAAYLPREDRLLFEQVVGQGQKLDALATLTHTSVPRLRRRLSRVRRRLADPCFLLATRYAKSLPAAVRPIMRSLYVDGLSLRECGVRHGLTLHGVRQALGATRALLLLTHACVPVGGMPDSDEPALFDAAEAEGFQ